VRPPVKKGARLSALHYGVLSVPRPRFSWMARSHPPSANQSQRVILPAGGPPAPPECTALRGPHPRGAVQPNPVRPQACRPRPRVTIAASPATASRPAPPRERLRKAPLASRVGSDLVYIPTSVKEFVPASSSRLLAAGESDVFEHSRRLRACTHYRAIGGPRSRPIRNTYGQSEFFAF
jgi:hypothetical protein